MAFTLRLGARILAFLAARKPGAQDVDRAVLYTVYGNDILVRLRRIHAHPERDGANGALVVTLHGRNRAQVSCSFSDRGNTLLCEVLPGAPASAEIAAALKEAGYWRDESSGRFLFRYEITKDSAVWGGASAVILSPLIDVFGARAGSKIEIVAPLALDRDEAAIRREMRGV
jgi:hypothetical protein